MRPGRTTIYADVEPRYIIQTPVVRGPLLRGASRRILLLDRLSRFWRTGQLCDELLRHRLRVGVLRGRLTGLVALDDAGSACTFTWSDVG